jgi:4'-phosphopantetheinyl transferase
MRSIEFGLVEIWRTATADDRCERRADEYLSILCNSERRRHDAFHFERDRHLYRVAHALVRNALSHYHHIPPADWRFKTGPYGRPEIDAPRGCPPLRFSLSHTHGLAVCAVSVRADLGIDVETADRDLQVTSLARQVFSPLELQELAARVGREQTELFFRYWTLKEAYIKAVGRGMSLPLRSISFRLAGSEEPKIGFSDDITDTPARWRFWQARSAGYHLALALASGPVRPTVTELEYVP